MECPTCSEPFNQEARRPKVLPCGHSVCLQCLLDPRSTNNECPLDKREIPPGLSNELPDNVAVISHIAQMEDSTISRNAFWCRDCDKALSTACAEAGHRPCSLRQQRAERVAPLVERLSADVAAEERLAAALEAARAAQLARVQTMQAALQRLRTAADSGASLEEATEAASTLGRPLPGVAEGRCRCSVTVEAEGGSPAWQASLPLGEHPLLRHLLLQALADGRLDEVPQQQPIPTVPAKAWPWRVTLDFEDRNTSLTQQEKDDILLDRRMEQVRSIKGLECKGEAFETQLLERAGPRLEKLHLDRPSKKQMEVVSAMASLRVLHAYNVEQVSALPPNLEELRLDLRVFRYHRHNPRHRCDERGLLAALRLPKLRSLFIGFTGNNVMFPEPLAERCGLRRLEVAMPNHNYKNMERLVRENAGTLEELLLYCNRESYCYSLRDLGCIVANNFQELRRVVLLRPGCCDDKDACRAQLEEVRERLQNRDVLVRNAAVLCNVCHPTDYYQ